MDEIPAQSILTPHIGEFKRLVGDYKNSYDQLNAQIEFSKKHKVIVVLKGAYTRITTPKGIVFFRQKNACGWSWQARRRQLHRLARTALLQILRR